MLDRISGIRAAGRINDRNRMHAENGLLTLISYHSPSESTFVETFDILTPGAPMALGSLSLAENERLYAVRVDGTKAKAYISTFLDTGSLWIIEFGNPRDPIVSGRLETLGRAAYIQAVGDLLLVAELNEAQGIYAAIALFDLRNRRAPKLLDREVIGGSMLLGQTPSYDGAFSAYPDHNLILFPFSNRDGDGVQLIDLLPETDDPLRPRGIIQHAAQVTSAGVLGDIILSVSAGEVLIASHSDRDQPAIARSNLLDHPWQTRQVLRRNDQIIQIGHHFPQWRGAGIRLSAQSTPGHILAEMPLPEEYRPAGATLQGELLYLALWSRAEFRLLVVRVGDASLEWVAEESMPFPNYNPPWPTRPLWINERTLVWARANHSGYSYNPIWWHGGRFTAPPAFGGHHIINQLNIGDDQFFAFDVSNPQEPKFASSISLRDTWPFTSERWDYGKAQTAGGKLFVSYKEREFVLGAEVEGMPQTVIRGLGAGQWVQRNFLRVIDFSDPRDPVVRRRVNIPGVLTAVSHDGSVIYTTDQHWEQIGESDGTYSLAAAAYDGVSASQLASLPLPRIPPFLLASQDGATFIIRPLDDQSAALERWDLNDAGNFELAAEIRMESPVADMAIIDDLLVVDLSDQLLLFNAGPPGSLAPVGSVERFGCFAFVPSELIGNVEDGLFAPLGYFGVLHIPIDAAGE